MPSPDSKGVLLDVDDLVVRYGAVEALHGVSMMLPARGIVAVIGANGAGKTTLLKSISGLLSPARGQVRFDGVRIDKLPPHKVSKIGIAHVPEGRHVFPKLTVQENLAVGWRRPSKASSLAEALEPMWSMFPALADARGKSAGLLSGGQQQMLAIARALISEPSLLMVDEPSLGLAPVIVDQVYDELARLGKELPVLIVEQNTLLALSVAKYAYVLRSGNVALEGTPEAIRNDPGLQHALLGLGVVS